MTLDRTALARVLLALTLTAFLVACGADDPAGGVAVAEPPPGKVPGTNAAAPPAGGDAAGRADAGGAGPAAAAQAARSPAPEVAGDPMGVVIRKFPNGLTVMLSENHESPRIATRIAIRAGSAKDPAESTGMAHYLEHMLFKGTPKMGTVDWEKEKPHLDRITALYQELFDAKDAAERARIYAEIDQEGVKATAYQIPNELDTIYDIFGATGMNAFTSNDITAYIVEIPSNRLDQWARVETERFRDPVFRLFQTEIEAVYEEYNQSLDSKGRAINEALMAALFPRHPYGTQTTIGTTEHLKNPSLRNMYTYLHKWYVPGNMCVMLAGDFDTAEALATLERTLGTWEAKPVPEDPVFPIEKPKGVVRVEVPFQAEEVLQIAFLTVPEGHPDQDVLSLCDMMLDNQQTGLINVNLGQTQAMKSAGSGPSYMNDAGFQILYGEPKPGQTLDECEKLLLDQIVLLKAGSFTEADLDAVITDFEVSQKRGLEGNDARIDAMSEAFISRQPWAHSVGRIDRMRKLTKADVVAAAKKYFGDDYVVVRRVNGKPERPVVEKPKFTPVETDGDRHSEFFTALAEEEVAPMEPQFAEKGRDYEVRDYPWGRLYYTHNPVNDIFDLSIQIEVGTNHDKRLEMAFPFVGLAGAGDLDPVAYKRKLYSIASDIGGRASDRETVFTASGLDAHLKETLDLLVAHFTQPNGVGPEDLEKLVQRELGGRMYQKQEPRAVAGALIQYALRGAKSPFLDTPTNEELAALKAEDLIAAVKDALGYRRIVTYVGQMPLDQVAAQVAPRPGTTLRATPAWEPTDYVIGNSDKVLFADANAAQATILILTTDGVFDPLRYPEGRVYNEYMSGSMGSVVFQEVREKRSLAYGVSTSYQLGDRVGDETLMVGQLTTQPDKTIEAIDVLLGLIREMPESETRFPSVIQAIDSSYRTRRLGFRQMPGAALTWDRWGTGKDTRPYNWEKSTALTLEQLAAFAARFKDKPYTIAIAGPKDRIAFAELAKYGEVVEVPVDDLFNW